MANISFTFWISTTSKVTMKVPYLGDLTSATNRGPMDWPNDICLGIGNINVKKEISYREIGRMATNLMLVSGSLTYGTSNTMTHGFQSVFEMYGGSNPSSYIQTFGSGLSNSQVRLNNNRPKIGACVALASIDGTLRLGLLVSGTNHSNGLDNSFFLTNTANNSAWTYIYNNSIHKGDPTNPYSPGGYNDGPKGGDDSNFSEDTDEVPIGDLPDETVSAIGSGFSTLFTPSKSQLRHLQGIMWGSNIVNFFQNMVENIGEMFVSLGVVPFNVPAGNTVSVKWFGIVDTAVSLTLAAKQWIRIDMGSVSVNSDNDKMYTTDTALDYTPYCKLGIYLPFIGFQDIDIDECRKATLHLYYDIDLMSGACVAKIEVAGSILYQFSGNCLSQIPLSSQDAQTLFTNAVNIGLAASGVGTAAAVAGAGDAVAAGENLSASEASLGEAKRAAQVSSAQSKLASCTANAAIGMKPNYTRTGAVGGPCAMLAEKTPYLYLRTSRQSMPEGYEKVCGFPCNMYGNLSTFSGYTVVEDIRLNHLVATAGEVEEIYKLLKSGVII